MYSDSSPDSPTTLCTHELIWAIRSSSFRFSFFLVSSIIFFFWEKYCLFCSRTLWWFRSNNSSHSSSSLPQALFCSQNTLNFYASTGIFFFILEFQWFLMLLSVLPSRYLAISAHLLPFPLWYRKSIHSSSSDHEFFLIFGFKWLCHLSQHYFPILPGKCSAIAVHFLGPAFSTSIVTSLSSSSVQGPLISFGFKTFCHRWRHCTSVLPFNIVAIFFQHLPLYFRTASSRSLSSSFVQWPLELFLIILLWILIFLGYTVSATC